MELCYMFGILTAFSVCSLINGKLYHWTKHPIDYPSDNYVLKNHVVTEFTKHLVIQCAMECLKTKTCQSYNFNKAKAQCQLNDAKHDDFADDFIASPEHAYFTRDTFSIDKEALGLCIDEPCQNYGKCLDTKSANGSAMYICFCTEGWTGTHCELEAGRPKWSEWADWGGCSVTCGRGYHTRSRQCLDTATGQALSPQACFGSDVEMVECTLQPCPRWDTWEAWGECSSDVTCGTGSKVRSRTCLHGGTPGVDRFCSGPINDTTRCVAIGCNLPLRLKSDGDAVFGEGLIEIYNDRVSEWREICAAGWDNAAATIACSQMGHQGLTEVVTDGRYGSGSGQIAITSLECDGSEHSLQACKHNKWSSKGSSCPPGFRPAALKCKVDGDWNMWSQWDECSVTCEDGIQTRSRECDNPPTLHGGKPCEGNIIDTKKCSMRKCPVDGEWTSWKQWNQCSVSCGGGTRMRKRGCTNPKHDGLICTGNYNQSEVCSDSPCPVDGYWMDWIDWSVCSVTCGGGTQSRSRICNEPQHGGNPCNGSNLDTQSCSTLSCPVDGTWQPWTPWDTCNVTCGGGTTKRLRHCNQPKFNGKLCSGDAEESNTCNSFPCPVDGSWKSWSEWALCDKTCGGGKQTRTRECKTPEHDGEDCQGNSSAIQQCNENPCPENGVWLEWLDWEPCSATCGPGSKLRSRVCDGPSYGGNDCRGDKDEPRACNEKECPVDGYWLTWEPWGTCSVSCAGGKQERSRDCQPGLHGGKNCTIGKSSEEQNCNEFACPLPATWTTWSSWGNCTESCGSGIQIRDRVCIGLLNGGKPCKGTPKSIKNCNSHHCPVNGTYKSWSSWEPCNVSCGGGVQLRYRNCTAPQYGGEDCEGPASEADTCGEKPCPVHGELLSWSSWGACTVTCNGGTSRRTRGCTEPKYGGKVCEGTRVDEQVCGEAPCPVDGQFKEWEAWSKCPVTCNGGVQHRIRECIPPQHGGSDCNGNATESQKCGETPCPVDGYFGEWELWSMCTASCNGGTQTRTRQCVPPEHGGLECNGSTTDSQACGEEPCPVDGHWDEWETWSACPLTCGGGLQNRTRECIGRKYGGKDCIGSRDDSKECATNACPIPGDWKDWAKWSVCSVSCEGGTRMRTRECDMDTHGDLTAPCEGHDKETGNCNQFDCFPYENTCTGWVKRGLEDTQVVLVNPKRKGPFAITCDVEQENGIGVGIIGHDREKSKKIHGYEGDGEYSIEINYNVTLRQAVAFVDVSEHCRQYLQWRCKGSLIHNPKSNGQTTYFMNRTHGVADYLGGGQPGSNSCACGMTQTCVEPELKCNCDKNDDVWREDSGFVTVKRDLPITGFAAGDTGDMGFAAPTLGVLSSLSRLPDRLLTNQNRCRLHQSEHLSSDSTNQIVRPAMDTCYSSLAPEMQQMASENICV